MIGSAPGAHVPGVHSATSALYGSVAMHASLKSLPSNPPPTPLFHRASRPSLKSEGAGIVSYGYRVGGANSIEFNLTLDENALAATALIFVDSFLRNPIFALQGYLMTSSDPRSALIAITLSKASCRSN